MSAGNGNLEEIEIPEKDKFIAHKNGILINDSLNELVLFGFYAENKNITELNINGFYYIKIDLDNKEIKTIKFNKLNKELMNKIFYENKTSKKTKTKDEIFNEILDKINDLDVKNI